MKRIVPAVAVAVALGLALAACSTTPTANVLRFHQNQPISRGAVYIRPANPQMANSLEFQTQANAVGAELRRNGFEPVPNPGLAQFTAVVDVQTTERIGPPRRSGMSVGIGGGFSSGNVGIGTSVQVPVGRTPPPNVATTTTLSVTLLANPGNQAVWEGRASLDTEAGGQRGTPLTPILAQTLFRDFPGPSGQTVQVPIR
jgi:hypothetical protein